MWWANVILKIYSTKKNTNFNRSRIVVESHNRLVDQYNNIVTCKNCLFMAPLSISFEEYMCLHDRYNFIVHKRVCSFNKSSHNCKILK
ncbi:AC56 [Trabala vishnou gigantina nucleopolyhedrovirus]|uniref:AC56 n=1 Tax=Trabala vishnou gigantina nucleopolyhedrovirus TaxID=2863583 RepID=UPI002481F773|nr:AC56 [Trabala vishnou gigantina nucleopolyhedrovirus]QYC92781.1 AC56 [Trabala vishnou gigantina nucleopolyhedrovirus]